MFYSSNQLLTAFLRNSMVTESLNPDDEKVKVWAMHKKKLVKGYKLVNSTLGKPFISYERTYGSSLLINKPKNLREVIALLESFYLGFQKKKPDNIKAINFTPFKWKQKGIAIQRYIADKTGIDSIGDVINGFQYLEKSYQIESGKICERYSSLVKKAAVKIGRSHISDPARVDTISKILTDDR